MTVFFTSDLHLGHNSVIEMANRPFNDVEQMNKALINGINARVATNDTLWILGDISYRISIDEAEKLIKKINCKDLRLIRGNHDKDWSDSNLFNEICDYKELKLDNRRVCLMHYPIASWKGMHRESVHLHGHCHSSSDYNRDMLSKGIRRLDIGVDANNYQPISWNEIIEMIEQAPKVDLTAGLYGHHPIIDVE